MIKINKLMSTAVFGSTSFLPLAMVNDDKNTIMITQKQIMNDIAKANNQKLDSQQQMVLISHNDLMTLLDSGKLHPSIVKKINQFLFQYSLNSKQIYQVKF